MNELALFAGAGGGILGGALLGWRTVCAVEISEYPRRVLLARQDDGSLPPFPIWDDACTFDGRPWRGIVDVVSGGFPCQDISSAGTGQGIAGSRSGLWRHMARIIEEVRPRYVFAENSQHLRSRGLDVVLYDLACMGYDARWGIFSACAEGAPHSRARMFVLADSYGEFSEIGKLGDGERQISLWGTSDAERSRGYFSFRERAASGAGGMANGVAHRVDRCRALGNGQVPIVAANAWRTLRGGIGNE